MRLFPLLCLAVWLIPFTAPAYDAGPAVKPNIATAQLITPSKQIRPGEPFFLALRLTYPEGWHTYWQNPGDSGLPSELKLTQPKHWKQEALHWPVPERLEWQGILDYGYSNEAFVLLPVTPLDDWQGKTTLRAKASWLVCKNICLPESAVLTHEVAADANAPTDDAAFNAILQRLPKPLDRDDITFAQRKKTVALRLPPEMAKSGDIAFFPLQQNTLKDSRPELIKRDGEQPYLQLIAGSKTIGERLEGVLVADGNAWQIAAKRGAYPAETEVGADAPGRLSLSLALLLALLGGVILNAMPCVFPILSLKALKLVGYARHSRRLAAWHGLAYSAGVILSMLGVAGALLLLKAQGEAVGWGFQLQSPFFVTAMTYLLFLIGLNLSGWFHLPARFGGWGHGHAAAENLTGTFFTGALATLVATPCSAPFMATALGYALTQKGAVALLIFGTLGVGLALPFLLLGLIPALARYLPRPGPWMETLRQFLAFPIYATLVWLVWVLAQQSGPGGMAKALSGLVLLAFTVWLWPHLRRRTSRLLWLLAMGVLLFALAKQSRDVPSPMENEIAYSEAEQHALLAAGRPFLINATAAWCLTCKVNESVALASERVQRHFSERQIKVLVADWTNRNDAVSRLLASFGRQGVPLYVYYDEQGSARILPQLLTPALLIEATQTKTAENAR